MKRSSWAVALSWLIGAGLAIARPAVAQDASDSQHPDPAADLLETFYQALSPSGQWVSMDGLGWCWRPSAGVVGGDFVPYATGGQWTFTADGWEFLSQWDWGDIVFHYGRWFEDANYGWLWVPGTDWAASWVDWRDTDTYAGWMPLPPDGLGVPTGPAAWFFVEFAYFIGPSAYLHALPAAQVASVFRSAQHVTSTRGPAMSVVQSAGVAVPVHTGAHPVTAVPVQPLAKQRVVHLTPPPGRRANGQLHPRFEPSSSSHGTPSPRHH